MPEISTLPDAKLYEAVDQLSLTTSANGLTASDAGQVTLDANSLVQDGGLNPFATGNAMPGAATSSTLANASGDVVQTLGDGAISPLSFARTDPGNDPASSRLAAPVQVRPADADTASVPGAQGVAAVPPASFTLPIPASPVTASTGESGTQNPATEDAEIDPEPAPQTESPVPDLRAPADAVPDTADTPQAGAAPTSTVAAPPAQSSASDPVMPDPSSSFPVAIEPAPVQAGPGDEGYETVWNESGTPQSDGVLPDLGGDTGIDPTPGSQFPEAPVIDPAPVAPAPPATLAPSENTLPAIDPVPPPAGDGDEVPFLVVDADGTIGMVTAPLTVPPFAEESPVLDVTADIEAIADIEASLALDADAALALEADLVTDGDASLDIATDIEVASPLLDASLALDADAALALEADLVADGDAALDIAADIEAESSVLDAGHTLDADAALALEADLATDGDASLDIAADIEVASPLLDASLALDADAALALEADLVTDGDASLDIAVVPAPDSPLLDAELFVASESPEAEIPEILADFELSSHVDNDDGIAGETGETNIFDEIGLLPLVDQAAGDLEMVALDASEEPAAQAGDDAALLDIFAAADVTFDEEGLSAELVISSEISLSDLSWGSELTDEGHTLLLDASLEQGDAEIGGLDTQALLEPDAGLVLDGSLDSSLAAQEADGGLETTLVTATDTVVVTGGLKGLFG